MDVSRTHPSRILERHANHLVVDTLLVLHVEDANRAYANATARERRLTHENECIERVAVFGESPFDVAVIGRVAH